MGGIVNAAKNLNRTRIFFFGGQVIIEWNRKTDFAGPSTNTVRVSSNFAKVVIDQQHSLVGFVSSGSTGEGKVFIDGVDETLSIGTLSVSVPVGVLDNVLIGNHVVGLGSDQFVDHYTLIQSDALDDAKVTRLVLQGDDTRGFGYFPDFTSVDFFNVSIGDVVTLTGRGFAKDVTITVGGIAATSVVRISESSVTFVVPPGIAIGNLNLAIRNPEADVTFTETAALNRVSDTNWSPNGGSTRVIQFGDGIISGTVRIGDPVPFCDPNVSITDWTRISRSPD